MKRLSYNRDQEYIVWDLETEGLNLFLSRPWQLAFIIYKNGKVTERHEHFILWEDLNIPAKVKMLTHFDEKKYKSLAKDPKEVCEIFSKYLYNEKYLLAGHNIISYDSHVFKTWALLAGMWKGWSFTERMVDTLCLSRMVHNDTRPDMDNFFSSQLKEIGKPPRGAKKANLTAMCKYFGIEVDETRTHDGSYDVEINAKVLEKLIYALDI